MQPIKIIHIINHPPAYEEFGDKPRPVVNWDTPAGNWVGIWGYDWADQIAYEILKISNEFEHEVWQPDLRADRIYSHTFKNGLVHRMFPAIKKPNKEIKSPLMLAFLSAEDLEHPIIFHITYPHFIGFNKDIIKTYKFQKIVMTFHGEIDLPLNALFRMQRNPFKKVYYLKQHFMAKRCFKLINHVTFMNNKNLTTLKKYYSGTLSKLTMGIDINKFKMLDKNEFKKKLDLPENTKCILTVSRLNSQKQVDRIIGILSGIDEDFDFIVIGHGTIQYDKILHKKASSLIKSNKIRFVGYKSGDELIEWLNAADVFILVSKSEGASVAVMEAMACGLPIICTDTGNTAEVLKEYNAGIIVGITDYKEWEIKIIDYLNGKPIKALDIDVVQSHYDWKNISNKIISIYKTIV